MKLNLASGDDWRDGYVNIDFREDVADVVADVADLKGFEDESVEEILALDALEHFPASRTQEILAEWRRVLCPGGLLTLRVPNLLRLANYIVEGRGVPVIITNIYGGHRWGPDGAWDAHHHGFVPSTIRSELEQAGFQFLGNDEGLNMTVKCRKR